jgi:hypothetical protein
VGVEDLVNQLSKDKEMVQEFAKLEPLNKK